MNTNASLKPKAFSMKRLQFLPLLLGVVLTTSGWVNAQTTAAKAEAPLTREQVKMERDEFLKSHRWDPVNDNWVLKPGYEAPVGFKSRTEVKAERDDFLRKHRYDVTESKWVPLTEEEVKTIKKSREQVREETKRFLSTHSWDEFHQVWTDKKAVAKKK